MISTKSIFIILFLILNSNLAQDREGLMKNKKIKKDKVGQRKLKNMELRILREVEIH